MLMSLKTIRSPPGPVPPVTVPTVTGTVTTKPSTVAAILPEPAATPVTRPDGETVATFGVCDDQVTVFPGTGKLLASRTVASSWNVWPGPVNVIAEVLNVIRETAGVTVTRADPATPSTSASRVVPPRLVEVASPVRSSMLTTDAFTLRQVTARSITLLLASRTTAVKRVRSLIAVNVYSAGVTS